MHNPTNPSVNPNQPATDQIPDLDQVLATVAENTRQKIYNDPALSQSLAPTPQMQNMIVDVEEELLKEIITRLEKSTLTVEKAQQLAKEFLSILPVEDQKDLLTKLHTLSNTNSDVRGLYLTYAVSFEEQERHKKLELMSKHLHSGNIEEALSVAKGGPNG